MFRPRAAAAAVSMMLLLGLSVSGLLFGLWLRLGVVMPGRSWQGPVAPNAAELSAPLQARLQQHVDYLAITIGPRHQWNGDSLERAANYIEGQFRDLGLEVHSQEFRIDAEQTDFRNLEVELPGTVRRTELVVVGAHYDTVPGSPGADDNATGIAALLEITRQLRAETLQRTVRLVAFVNEEEPYAETDGMGSIVYARALSAQGAKVHGMLALESLGYYRDEVGSQNFPWPLGHLYPDQANFLAFIGNVRSRRLLRTAIASFRSHGRLPSEGVSIPEAWAPDISRSDHAAFWRMGYPAIMVTDTVPFRNPHYHRPGDVPASLDFRRFALAVQGLAGTVRDLANH